MCETLSLIKCPEHAVFENRPLRIFCVQDMYDKILEEAEFRTCVLHRILLCCQNCVREAFKARSKE